jgi:hypothetical protein
MVGSGPETGNQAMKWADWGLTGLRWLYGFFFFSTGVVIALYLLFGPALIHPPVQPTHAAAALDNAFHASGIIDPLLAACYLVGGAALALRRTTPLGLVILAPAVVGIALFDWILAHLPLPAALTLGVWGVLVLRHFGRFRGLWTEAQPLQVAKVQSPG